MTRRLLRVYDSRHVTSILTFLLSTEDEYQTGTGGSLYDGRQQVLYWADVLSELALVVPSPETYRLRSLSTSEIGTESKFLLYSWH